MSIGAAGTWTDGNGIVRKSSNPNDKNRSQFGALARDIGGVTLEVNPEPTPSSIIADALDMSEVAARYPKGITETRAALNNKRAEPNQEVDIDGEAVTRATVRMVNLSWDSVPPAKGPTGGFDVHGPANGRPIILNLNSGIPFLHVRSGYAIISASSHAGNSINVEAGARADIICDPDRKVSIHAAPGSTVRVFAEDGVRGYWGATGDAVFEVHGVDRVAHRHEAAPESNIEG